MTAPARAEPWVARLLAWLARVYPVRYAEYIHSAAWRRKVSAAKRRALYRCQLCNTPDWVRPLQGHHRTYERLGVEIPEDITVLCRPCHARHHGRVP
jgi:5-methylcytosine-specific restriction endonuclease McrA